MCEICLNSHRGFVTRRGALGLTVSALAATLVVPRAMAANDKPPPKPQNVIAPAAALDRLMKGNSRYVTGVSLRHDFMHEREALSTGQNPFAAVLSCADSRIAPELLRYRARRLIRLPHRRQFRQRRNDRQPGICRAGAQHALDHGARTRSMRRGRRHN